MRPRAAGRGPGGHSATLLSDFALSSGVRTTSGERRPNAVDTNTNNYARFPCQPDDQEGHLIRETPEQELQRAKSLYLTITAYS